MLPPPPLPPISLCSPFDQPQSISAEQLIPFSKARPCHSSAQTPPKACQHGAETKSFLGWTLVIGTLLHPHLSLTRSCFSDTGFYCANGHAKHSLPQGLCTACSLSLQLSAGLPTFTFQVSDEMLPHFRVALHNPSEIKGNPSGWTWPGPPLTSNLSP